MLSWLFVLAGVACGGDDGPPSRDGGADGGGVCGNLVPDPGEECDDGNRNDDDDCKNDCTVACGNGVVDGNEQCDTGIALGQPGACPTLCDDSNACTTDTLIGSLCQAQCVAGLIIQPTSGDGCCPTGITLYDDSDCAVVCGNGVVEPGEKCDTAIPSGSYACPAAAPDCDDGEPCTTEGLTGTACEAECTYTEITAFTAGDACCPAGGTATTGDPGYDPDCSVTCGDGIKGASESCDTAIASGSPGACPVLADCDDGDVCTDENLLSEGTCNARCQNVTRTPSLAGPDSCCPPGASSLTDSDCTAACGNGTREGTEECDDGNTSPGDGCDATCHVEASSTPTAFRITELMLRDPHVFLSFAGACIDATDLETPLASGVNPMIRQALTTDDDGDGLLDMSVVQVFRPLDQAAATTPSSIVFADCTASSTSCMPKTGVPTVETTATNRVSGDCLGVVSGTTSGYSPPVVVPSAGSAGCYETASGELDMSLGVVSIRLRATQIAAAYSGEPASELVNGLMRGFLSEADAEAAVIPADLPIVGGKTLASLLPGGSGGCSTNDNRDTHEGTRGWWFYLNFRASAAPYSE